MFKKLKDIFSGKSNKEEEKVKHWSEEVLERRKESNSIDKEKIEEDANNLEEKQEKARQEKARQEKEKQEKEKQEKEKQEKARQEKEKQEKEKQEKERQEKERQEKERQEKERQEKERQEKEIQEKERQEKERQEKERQEKERQEKERQEKERQEKERQEKERQEKERQEKERQEKERQEKERQEKERQEKERQEKERQEKERQEKERQEKEKEEKPKKRSFFDKLVDGLDKTRRDMTNKLNSVFASFTKVDEELFEDLEEILVTADVGVETTMNIIDALEEKVKLNRVTDPEEVRKMLQLEIKEAILSNDLDNELNIEPSPAIILVVGVNGVGKTTTIGKLANNLRQDGKSVLIAAGDTFRAAAIEQLEEWGNRANVDIISHSEGSDPAAVIYDGIQAAKARKSDVLICDTAGRLHNKKNLMDELNKIFRVTEREYPEASKEVLLVLDATTGQNALSQAKTFKEVTNITGVALTKLDGTAKGGVVIPLQSELNLPVKLIGIGEGIDDLHEFDPDTFVDALFK